MIDREKVIKGLEWILKDDRFGFGVNWETGEPRDDYEKAGKIITDTIILLKEQANEYENGFNDAMLGKQELMYEGTDGKWYKKDW